MKFPSLTSNFDGLRRTLRVGTALLGTTILGGDTNQNSVEAISQPVQVQTISKPVRKEGEITFDSLREEEDAFEQKYGFHAGVQKKLEQNDRISAILRKHNLDVSSYVKGTPGFEKITFSNGVVEVHNCPQVFVPVSDSENRLGIIGTIKKEPEISKVKAPATGTVAGINQFYKNVSESLGYVEEVHQPTVQTTLVEKYFNSNSLALKEPLTEVSDKVLNLERLPVGTKVELTLGSGLRDIVISENRNLEIELNINGPVNLIMLKAENNSTDSPNKISIIKHNNDDASAITLHQLPDTSVEKINENRDPEQIERYIDKRQTSVLKLGEKILTKSNTQISLNTPIKIVSKD